MVIFRHFTQFGEENENVVLFEIGGLQMKVRLLSVSRASANGKDVPALRISGDWLEKIGFRQGKNFIVKGRAGELTLQLVTLEEAGPCE